jgi:hypothetical protein
MHNLGKLNRNPPTDIREIDSFIFFRHPQESIFTLNFVPGRLVEEQTRVGELCPREVERRVLTAYFMIFSGRKRRNAFAEVVITTLFGVFVYACHISQDSLVLRCQHEMNMTCLTISCESFQFSGV